MTPDEKEFFLENGYLIARGVLEGDLLKKIQDEFEEVWAAETPGRCNQHKLLKYRTFIDLIEHHPVIERLQAIFGNQLQLLQYDFLRQERNDTFPLRAWHKDFSFTCGRPLTINSIIYLDEMTPDRGQTHVVPGSHRWQNLPTGEEKNRPHENEVAVEAAPGDAVFINSAIWHTGSRNQAEGLRRGLYMYYGYWWLKRYECDQKLPWQAYENASDMRLKLLGLRMPDRDIHMYDPSL
ncbi:MAG: phytanoyl-CoA dioxygenase family protein [Planctomycetota bacterium]|nr:phytanoyl-CoA dioxygenase family protein [Planctomycetota bacterium]